MLQFARLESLLQQAARSPGRQSWKADGADQVRAATGDLSHCCLHAPLMLPFCWCTLCLSAGVLFDYLLVYSLPFCWCNLCLSAGVLFAFLLVYSLPFCWCTLCLSAGALFAFLRVYSLPVGLGSSPIAAQSAHSGCQST